MNSEKSYSLNVRGRLFSLSHPCVMGILNATPDSFYAESRVGIFDEKTLLERVRQMISDGVDIVDVGACSTRPGSEGVGVETEIERLKPVLQAIRREFPDLILSVDTYHAEVARFAVEECGVDIVNDVSGGSDRRMWGTVARMGVPYVLTCAEGGDMKNVLLTLARDVSELRARGVKDIIVDPGFGFGKSLEENYGIMREISMLHELNCPILVGVSRKSMVTEVLRCDAAEALTGTTVLHAFALLNGVQILRVHDVKAAVESVKIMEKLQK